MNFKWLKKAGNVISAGVKVVDKYGPQIMAVISTGCFVGSIIFAVKESPKAMAALEEKESSGQKLNVVEKGATIMSNMPWTFTLAGAGLGLQFLSWYKESARMAALTGLVATQFKDNQQIVEAAKEIVGPEKTKEILERKEEMRVKELKQDEDEDHSQNWRYYPFVFPIGGDAIWMTWDQFDERMEKNITQLADNTDLSLYDYMENMGSDNPPNLGDLGWSCDGCGASASDFLRWAKEELGYQVDKIDYKDNPRIPGFRVSWDNIPTPAN